MNVLPLLFRPRLRLRHRLAPAVHGLFHDSQPFAQLLPVPGRLCGVLLAVVEMLPDFLVLLIAFVVLGFQLLDLGSVL